LYSLKNARHQVKEKQRLEAGVGKGKGVGG